MSKCFPVVARSLSYTLQDTAAPSVTLASGEVVNADLVIAADGIHSIAVETVLGQPNPPQPQDHYNCCYRFLIPASVLADDAETAFFTEGREGKMRVWADNDNSRRLVCYPCRKCVRLFFHMRLNADGDSNELLNFVAMFYDAEMREARKEGMYACNASPASSLPALDWHASANKSQMLDLFKSFHPSLLNVME